MPCCFQLFSVVHTWLILLGHVLCACKAYRELRSSHNTVLSDSLSVLLSAPSDKGMAHIVGQSEISLYTSALLSTTTPPCLSIHSEQGQGADETWNRRKLQFLSALVGEEEVGINGRAKMQFSFGYCHLSHYVLALQPSREAVLASMLSLQCYYFSVSLDFWGAGGIN